MNEVSLMLLIGAQTAPADTVVTVAARDAVDVVYAIAAGSVALTFFAICAGLLFALWQLRKLGQRMEALGEKVSGDPGVESLRRVSANLEAISHSARREVEHLSGSVSRMSDRLTQVSERMEERIEEFNALMEVVQEEAESTFVSTASTARGVREGLTNVGRAARSGTSPNPRPGGVLSGSGGDGSPHRRRTDEDPPVLGDEDTRP